MKRKLDFVIYESDTYRMTFRFYPKKSHCHSFNDEPPKTWLDVYKVYYSWAILKQWKNENGDIEKTIVLFTAHCDECSVIDEISARCNLLSRRIEQVKRKNGDENYKIKVLNRECYPMGMGISWIIRKTRNKSYIFEVWNFSNNGFRFELPHKRIKEFGEYLLMCCNYMLEHGEPI